MNIFRFLKWPMYIDAKRLNKTIGEISKSFPIEAKKKYYNQLNRASLSVCLNIAEGAGRYSDIELCRFLDIALGSLAELVACIDNLKNEGYLSHSEFNEIYSSAEHISKQIQGMKCDTYKNPRKFKKRAIDTK